MNKRFIFTALMTILVEAFITWLFSYKTGYSFLELTFFVGIIFTGLLLIYAKRESITRFFKMKPKDPLADENDLTQNPFFMGTVIYTSFSFIAIFISYLLWIQNHS
ncbi:hypothetical protein [Thermoflavimicrobium dichotomicum]|uniref:Uncharacterized protein n=1 Tax=Thermoflavimicrobium dichotomicum TaxID=46223 RepID=A0A1I3RPS5_9BACL|nr:hypothetical protein [Thermoflavimicrobium dichotomicum]SFJ47186.1 hypothetical protein SAMN05421852_11094 [Thermoflavimicrobium dichotomicum]